MLIDAGHNSSTGWRPSDELDARGIRTLDTLVITNCDEDHASDLRNVLEEVAVRILYHNRSVTRANLMHLKGQDHAGAGIQALAGIVDVYVHPILIEPDFGGLSIKTFCNRYPTDFEDENNLSLLTILEWPTFKIVFPGDLEVAGWRRLLQRSEVRAALQDTTVLVASHHGRMNGYTEEIFSRTGMQPAAIVVSDSGIDYETQKTGPLYRRHARGFDLNGERRRVLTTRRDGRITFEITSGTTLVTTSRSGPPLF